MKRKSDTTQIDKFREELQAFLDARHASLFFGDDHHAEVWADGERIGALTHNDVAELERHDCDC